MKSHVSSHYIYIYICIYIYGPCVVGNRESVMDRKWYLPWGAFICKQRCLDHHYVKQVH